MDEIRTVAITTVPHNSQRYDTIGDWLYSPAESKVAIYTSDLGDWRMSLACAVHELIETALCVNDGVREEDVSAFDVAYEAARQAGKAARCGCTPTEDSEPGEDAHAPYRKQHAFADGVERLFANALGVVWDEYAERVLRVSEQYECKPFDPFNENGEASEDVDG